MKHPDTPEKGASTPEKGASKKEHHSPVVKKELKAKKEHEREAEECQRPHLSDTVVGEAKALGTQLDCADVNFVLGYALGLTSQLIALERKGRIILARDRTEQRSEVIDVRPPRQARA